MTQAETGTQRIGVTGSEGYLGRYVVRELTAAGYDVIAVDRRAPQARAHGITTFRAGDLLDRAALPALLGDCEAIVHLAARPSPAAGSADEVFGENVATTANVLELAEARGMRRVVLASSECAVGYAYGYLPFPLDYLPVDEAHPLRPDDPYGRSKKACEELAAATSARSGMTTVALRPTWILSLEHSTRREWAREHHLPPSPSVHPHTFWGYVDARDAARAFRLALEAPLTGFEAFFIAARDTRHNLPTIELIRPYWSPDQLLLASGVPGHSSILDSTKAERLLGWTPEHSWRDLSLGWADVARPLKGVVIRGKHRVIRTTGRLRRLVRMSRREAHTT